MKIPFLDLKSQILPNKEEYLEIIKRVIEDTAFSSGKYVDDFELNFAKYLDVKFTIGVNSGTSALHLALLALDIGQGDEVILPSHTFIATAWAVSYVGATPIFVDIEENYYTIDYKKIEEKITNKTKAVIAVHLYGQSAELNEINDICKKHNIFLIEDASQAIGVEYNLNFSDDNNDNQNKDNIFTKVSTIGDIGTFSFYPGKNLGAFGEGGAIVTNNESYNKRLRALRNHAQTERYFHSEIGFNYRMDGIQGAILNYKLDLIDSWNKKRNQIAQKFNESFKNLENIIIPKTNPNSTHIYHLYELGIKSPLKRELLINFLNKKEVNTGLHYPVPIHLQEAYKELTNNYQNDLHNTIWAANSLISLPIYSELTDEQVDYIIQCVLEWYNLQ